MYMYDLWCMCVHAHVHVCSFNNNCCLCSVISAVIKMSVPTGVHRIFSELHIVLTCMIVFESFLANVLHCKHLLSVQC